MYEVGWYSMINSHLPVKISKVEKIFPYHDKKLEINDHISTCEIKCLHTTSLEFYCYEFMELNKICLEKKEKGNIKDSKREIQ